MGKDDTWIKDISKENLETLSRAVRQGIQQAKRKRRFSMEERRGVIQDVKGNGSILELIIKLEDGRVERVLAENGPTVRALAGLFGRDIIRGHSLDVSRIKGQEISFDTDDLGILAYISD